MRIRIAILAAATAATLAACTSGDTEPTVDQRTATAPACADLAGRPVDPQTACTVDGELVTHAPGAFDCPAASDGAAYYYTDQVGAVVVIGRTGDVWRDGEQLDAQTAERLGC